MGRGRFQSLRSKVAVRDRVRIAWRAAATASAIWLAAASAWAGGAGLYEIGTPDLGTAAAGRAAAANDASTTFGNPAGMTRLKGFQIVGGLQLVQLQVFFDPQRPPTDNTGGAGGNAGGFSPLPAWGGSAPGAGLYTVYSIDDAWKLGFSINTYAGGAVDYDSDWTGRYFLQRSDLLTLNFNPTVAYRVAPWFSIGAGFSIQYAKLVQKTAINNLLDPGVGDGRIVVRDDNVGFGGNIGLLFELDAATRGGIIYRSQVDQNFDDVASVSNLGPVLRASLAARGLLGKPVDMSLTIPQEVMLSAYRDLTPRIAVMGNLGWQNWAAFGKPELTVSNTQLTVDQDYQDTFSVAIGGQFRLMDPLLLSTGFCFDTSAVSGGNRTVSFAVDDQYRIGLGLQYHLSDSATIGMAYELLLFGSAPLEQSSTTGGTLSGDFSTNMANFVNFTLVQRF